MPKNFVNEHVSLEIVRENFARFTVVSPDNKERIYYAEFSTAGSPRAGEVAIKLLLENMTRAAEHKMRLLLIEAGI